MRRANDSVEAIGDFAKAGLADRLVGSSQVSKEAVPVMPAASDSSTVTVRRR